MNKFTTFLLLLSLSTVALWAQKLDISKCIVSDTHTNPIATERLHTGMPNNLFALFGYANKNVDIPQGYWLGSIEQAIITAAIKLPRVQEGWKLRGITFAYHNSTEPNGKIVLMEDTGEIPNYTVVVEQFPLSIKAGWNSFTFPTPIVLDPAKQYFLGYQFDTQAGPQNNSPICYDHEGSNSIKIANMVASKTEYASKGDNLYFVSTDAYKFGNLMIYADIDDTSAPMDNLAVLLGVDKIKESTNSSFSITSRVRNIGKNNISKMSLALMWGGETTIDGVSAEKEIESNETTQIQFTHGGKSEDKGKLKVAIDKVNEVPNAIIDTLVTTYQFFNEQYSADRNAVLLETYTSENCQYCPRVKGFIENLEKHCQETQEKVNVITYHVNDAFSIDEAIDLGMKLFNASKFYTPACVYDRRHLYIERNELTFGPSKAIIINKFDQAIQFRKKVFLEKIDQQVNDNHLNLTIKGIIKDPMIREDYSITAVITENNIAPISQAGAGSDYMHQHVARIIFPHFGGTPIRVDNDGLFSVNMNNIPLSDSWIKDNLHVVVIVHRNPSDEKLGKRYVDSSVELALGENMGTPIISEEDNDVAVAVKDGKISINTNYSYIKIYDLSGRLIASDTATKLPSGYYVIVFSANGREYKKKVMIP